MPQIHRFHLLKSVEYLLTAENTFSRVETDFKTDPHESAEIATAPISMVSTYTGRGDISSTPEDLVLNYFDKGVLPQKS